MPELAPAGYEELLQQSYEYCKEYLNNGYQEILDEKQGLIESENYLAD